MRAVLAQLAVPEHRNAAAELRRAQPVADVHGGLIADKLVVKGENGLYYKLNTDGVTTETEQTEYNSLNGSVITAK